jgi:outer membrane protein insertion porin family
MGNVFNAGDKLQLRQAVGFGLSWVSPVGPLRISYGKPLNPQSGDRIQRMQFQIGTAF